MEWRLLGPFEVLVGGDPVDLGGRQRRTLLAVLVVHNGEPVSTDRLIDELWGDAPPRAARKTVQAHVAHLRSALNVDEEVLSSSGDGYELLARPEEIDARRFETIVAGAREAKENDPRAAASELERALELFRGAPLAGLADNAFSLRVEAERLGELRISAIEDRLEALLAAGESQTVAVEAERLVADHPLREGLWSLLMIGLYREGRQAEALRAYSRLRQILAEELGIEPSQDLQRLEARILDQDSELSETAPANVGTPASITKVTRNPYKGLRAFDEADAADFFGRSELVGRLQERLESRVESRLTVLAGPSGAGKSSVVRAGLMPQLRDRMRVALMVPGNDPFAALAKALGEATDEAPDELLVALAEGETIFDDPVIVVDQLEELYTLAPADAAEGFLDLMASRHQGVRWVVTVRADFLDNLMTHQAVGTMLDRDLVLIPPLQEHEIRAVVTRPAERVNVGVEPELVAAVANDVQSRPSALPLLQYALTDTFERRRGDLLTLDDYQRSGGISGAVARRAEELFSSLRPHQQELARLLFLQMVTVTEEGELARRRVERDSMIGEPEELARILERFGSMRLLTFDQDTETGRPTVEVAHEALMAEWPRLAGWIEAARDDLRMARRLAMAASEWEEAGRDEGYLLSGSRLDEFETWVRDAGLATGSLEDDYVHASVIASRANRRRRERVRRLIMTGIAASVLIATALAVFGISQRQATAEQALVVRAGDLASAANANLAFDPEQSVLLALEAVETTQREGGPVLAVAEEALHRAVLADRLLLRVPNGGNGIAHFSPSGDAFVTQGEDPTTAQVWSANPGEILMTLAGHEADVVDAVYSPDGSRIASTSFDGTVRVWDTASGETEMILEVNGPPPLVPVFSWDGRLLAASSVSGTTWVWDLETQDLVWELVPPEGTRITVNLEFSPDGSLLVVAPETEQWVEGFGAHVWDMETGELITILQGHTWDVKDVGFTPDGTRLLTGSFDATVKEWDTETWQETRTFFGAGTSVWDLQISADGTHVAISGNKMARVFDLETFEVTDELVGHVGIVDGIDISPDGQVLLTASMVDSTTRLWDLSGEATYELMALPANDRTLFAGVAFNPDGTRLAASRDIGQVTIWEFPEGRELRTFEGPGVVINSITYDPTGRYLAVAGTAGAALLDADGNQITSLSDVESFHASFSPEGDRLVVVDANGVHLWELPVDGDPETLSNRSGWATAFHPTRDLIAMSIDDGDEGIVEVLDLASGQVLTTLTDHGAPVWRLQFSPDGRWLATASLDATAALWNTETFERERLLAGHFDQVFKAVFDPVRPELATASSDETLKIWSLETGEVLLTIPGGGNDIAYRPDGSYIAGVSPETPLTVYIRDVDELAEHAKRRLTRWWTEDECARFMGSDTCPPPPGHLAASG